MDLLINLFYQAEDYFFRSISKKCLDFDDLATAYFTEINAESLNLIYIRKDAPIIGEILNQCKIFYDTHNSPWSVMIAESFILNDLEQSLSNLGFGFSEKSVAMFIELNKESRYDFADDIVIHSVNDKLEQWMIPLISAFESTIDITQQYANAHEKALKNKANFHHFTLYKNGLPISSLTISLQNNVARIDDVGTLPAHQNKGYATELMKYAMNEAFKLGARYCFLEASESGVSVYQKLGFRALFKNNVYSHTRLC